MVSTVISTSGTRSSEFGLVTAAGSHSIAPFAGIRRSSFPQAKYPFAHGCSGPRPVKREKQQPAFLRFWRDCSLFWRGRRFVLARSWSQNDRGEPAIIYFSWYVAIDTINLWSTLQTWIFLSSNIFRCSNLVLVGILRCVDME
jgi:hypothetical protein